MKLTLITPLFGFGTVMGRQQFEVFPPRLRWRHKLQKVAIVTSLWREMTLCMKRVRFLRAIIIKLYILCPNLLPSQISGSLAEEMRGHDKIPFLPCLRMEVNELYLT
ncbi:hypothetical protein M6B38_281025 [Iris pallida]|uniref:Uncharacterized protein n=1 Tax=Iris pallida TaxID=29817 RepID=A0AAX6I147_IRIPA|nr:hypothetical protein M6B38_281025 [Iris pallida]